MTEPPPGNPSGKITLPSLSKTTVINASVDHHSSRIFLENKVIKYIYSQTYAVEGGIGYSSAMSFLFFIVLVVLLLIIYLLLNVRTEKKVK